MTIFYIFLIVLIIIFLITGIVVTVIEKRSLNVSDDVEFQKTKVFEIVHDNDKDSQVKENSNGVNFVENSIKQKNEVEVTPNNVENNNSKKEEVIEEIELLDIDEENDIPVIKYSEVIVEDSVIWLIFLKKYYLYL